jgi:UDPglucose--hexose-1-phosphate uridylyltransferase
MTADPPPGSAPGAAGAHRADLRIDALTGRPVVVVGSRQGRPNIPVEGCPFCPGGLEAPEDYDVRWFPNRWPALPDERCEMVLYTPVHDAEFWTLGTAGARRVVDLWAERTAALGSRDDVAYVLVFENRGTEVGATIPHPHGQIYAFDEVPPEPLQELLDGALDPGAVEDGRIVCAHGDWQAWVPEAASWPYELRIAPRPEVPDLVDPACDRDGLAATLVDALARLDQLFDAVMPYMLWIHQRPTDGGDWPGARVHVHVAPLYRRGGTQRYVAAGELGAGVYFNPVDPLTAAAELRALPGAI